VKGPDEGQRGKKRRVAHTGEGHGVGHSPTRGREKLAWDLNKGGSAEGGGGGQGG